MILGTPYESAKKEMAWNFVLGKLLEQGISENQQGVSVHKLNYDELKYELVLASFREIDSESDANKWF